MEKCNNIRHCVTHCFCIRARGVKRVFNIFPFSWLQVFAYEQIRSFRRISFVSGLFHQGLTASRWWFFTAALPLLESQLCASTSAHLKFRLLNRQTACILLLLFRLTRHAIVLYSNALCCWCASLSMVGNFRLVEGTLIFEGEVTAAAMVMHKS